MTAAVPADGSTPTGARRPARRGRCGRAALPRRPPHRRLSRCGTRSSCCPASSSPRCCSPSGTPTVASRCGGSGPGEHDDCCRRWRACWSPWPAPPRSSRSRARCRRSAVTRSPRSCTSRTGTRSRRGTVTPRSFRARRRSSTPGASLSKSSSISYGPWRSSCCSVGDSSRRRRRRSGSWCSRSCSPRPRKPRRSCCSRRPTPPCTTAPTPTRCRS